jgi:hypothetical protein
MKKTKFQLYIRAKKHVELPGDWPNPSLLVNLSNAILIFLLGEQSSAFVFRTSSNEGFAGDCVLSSMKEELILNAKRLTNNANQYSNINQPKVCLCDQGTAQCICPSGFAGELARKKLRKN